MILTSFARVKRTKPISLIAVQRKKLVYTIERSKDLCKQWRENKKKCSKISWGGQEANWRVSRRLYCCHMGNALVEDQLKMKKWKGNCDMDSPQPSSCRRMILAGRKHRIAMMLVGWMLGIRRNSLSLWKRQKIHKNCEGISNFSLTWKVYSNHFEHLIKERPLR